MAHSSQHGSAPLRVNETVACDSTCCVPTSAKFNVPCTFPRITLPSCTARNRHRVGVWIVNHECSAGFCDVMSAAMTTEPIPMLVDGPAAWNPSRKRCWTSSCSVDCDWSSRELIVLPPERHWEAHQYDEPSVAAFDAKNSQTQLEN